MFGPLNTGSATTAPTSSFSSSGTVDVLAVAINHRRAAFHFDPPAPQHPGNGIRSRRTEDREGLRFGRDDHRLQVQALFGRARLSEHRQLVKGERP